MTASAYTGPTWSADYYALIGEPGTGRSDDRLMLCTIHGERHVRHGNDRTGWWCQALEPHRRGPRPSRLRQSPEPPPLRVVVELDTETIGEAVGSGLVLAFRRVRAERTSQRAEREPSPTPTPTAASNDVPTIPVWTPDDSAE
jgi:hypothetical protein